MTRMKVLAGVFYCIGAVGAFFCVWGLTGLIGSWLGWVELMPFENLAGLAYLILGGLVALIFIGSGRAIARRADR